MATHGHFHLGTSGWSYTSWRGVFYPPGLPQKEWLAHYATRFGCVEVNNSFYRLPRAETVAHWVATVPPSFRFSFKVWRMVTHLKKLHATATPLAKFMRAVHPAAAHGGPLLAQLPPQLHANPPLLAKFLETFAKANTDGWPLAVEFRHASWYQPEVCALLDSHRAALVLHDMPGSACHIPNIGSPFIYLRFHGPTGTYGSSYTDKALKDYAARIRSWLAEGKHVYAFFNNDRDGAAVANAATLAAQVAG